MVHGNAVAHGNGGKFQRCAASHAHTGLYGLCNAIKVQVPGNDFACSVDHTHERALDFFLGEPQGVEERSVRGLFKAALHERTAGVNLMLVVHW